MAAKAPSRKATKPSAPAPESVDAFLASLDHPLKPAILALREIILSADPSVSEGIKWNAPSFRTTEYFATFHLRAKEGVQIILHLGAKARDTAISGGAVEDPEALLEWLGKDRASVRFRDLKDVRSKRDAFETIIRAWIKHV